jgi:hypothetical protein
MHNAPIDQIEPLFSVNSCGNTKDGLACFATNRQIIYAAASNEVADSKKGGPKAALKLYSAADLARRFLRCHCRAATSGRWAA